MHLQLSTSILFCLLTTNVVAAEQATLSNEQATLSDEKATLSDEKATLSDEKAILSYEADRINYSIGHQIGTDFKRQKVKLNEQALRQGLQHGQSGTAPVLKQKEMQALLVELKRNITDKMKKDAVERISSRKQIENKKRSEGEDFMRENQTRQGVITMPSGLQYKVLKKGDGIKPKVDDYVTFHYQARKLNGKVYDSSLKKGGPVTYGVNGVIPGFTEAVQMMRPGAKWELYIPPDLAYGRRSPLAHQTVIIVVELLSVSKRK